MCSILRQGGRMTGRLGVFIIMFLIGYVGIQAGSAQVMNPGDQTMPGMMSQGEMWRMGDIGCSMMSELATSVSRILSYRDEINLTPGQVDQLKSIRDSYQRDAVTLYDNLHASMAELSRDLESEKIDMTAIRKANGEIEKNQAELRSRNIEVFLKSRAVLTADQIDELRARGLWNTSMLPWHQGMMQP